MRTVASAGFIRSSTRWRSSTSARAIRLYTTTSCAPLSLLARWLETDAARHRWKYVHAETRRRGLASPQDELYGSSEANYTNFVQSLPAERQRYSPIYLHSTGIHYGSFLTVLAAFRARANAPRSRLSIGRCDGGPHRSLPRAHLSFFPSAHQAVVCTYSQPGVPLLRSLTCRLHRDTARSDRRSRESSLSVKGRRRSRSSTHASRRFSEPFLPETSRMGLGERWCVFSGRVRDQD